MRPQRPVMLFSPDCPSDLGVRAASFRDFAILERVCCEFQRWAFSSTGELTLPRCHRDKCKSSIFQLARAFCFGELTSLCVGAILAGPALNVESGAKQWSSRSRLLCARRSKGYHLAKDTGQYPRGNLSAGIYWRLQGWPIARARSDCL